MNKQQRYLSLMMLVTAISAKGMELQTTDAPNQEDAPDKFAVLKPKLSATEREQLQYTVNSLAEVPTREEILEAYKAALALEVDQTPDERAKDIIASRKNLWNMLKAASTDANAAKISVDYLSGSENEQEDADDAAKLNQLVARVHRRDSHVAQQASRLKALTSQEVGLKTQETKLTVQLDAVKAKKQPLDTNMEELIGQESDLTGQKDAITAKQAAVQRVVENSTWLVEQEPLLAQVAPELLQPVLTTELGKEQEQVAAKLATLIVAKEALSKQIDPLTAQIAQLTDEQGKNNTARNELAQLLVDAQKAQTLAQTDREKILVRIDQRIETTAAQRESFKAEAAELAKQVAAEKDAEQKATLLASKKAKDAEVAAVIQTISALKVARAQADNTYRSGWWALGYYNGDK